MKSSKITKIPGLCPGRSGKEEYLEKIMRLLLIAVFFTGIAQLRAQEEMAHGAATDVIIYEAGSINWQDGPASFEEGARFALLEGNPGEEGYFNLRLKLPDGFKIAPHWHPNIERITVVSGAFLLGHGKEANRENTQRLGPGSYASLPKEMVHFAFTEGETIVQLATMGPWKIHYVNPQDDPRNRN